MGKKDLRKRQKEIIEFLKEENMKILRENKILLYVIAEFMGKLVRLKGKIEKEIEFEDKEQKEELIEDISLQFSRILKRLKDVGK